MAQGPSDTILVAIRITLRIRESKVRNPDPPYYSLIVSCHVRRRFVLSERILVCSVVIVNLFGRVLSYCRDGDGPRHIKVVLEWEYTLYKRYGLGHYCKIPCHLYSPSVL